ncbi:hypothetical protein OSTOST_17843 [Ostertagia ostertagi]
MPDMVGGFAELFEIFAKNGSSVKEFLTVRTVCSIVLTCLHSSARFVAEVCGVEHAMQLNEAILARSVWIKLPVFTEPQNPKNQRIIVRLCVCAIIKMIS